MEVDAHVFYWTRQGMRTQPLLPHSVGYIQRGEVERLLEDAYRRGYEQAVTNHRMGASE